MIYLVVGGSCAGKSTFVKEKFLNNNEYFLKRDLLPYIETQNSYIIGTIKEDSRRFGTDTISRSQIHLIVPQVINFIAMNPNKDIILEGDRIVSRNIFNQLKELNIEIKLYLIKVSLELCIQRNRENNSTSSDSSLKSSITRSENIFNEYKELFNGEIINNNKEIKNNKYRDDFAIFILSHGRANKVKTLKTLKDCGYSGKWYIIIDNEDRTYQEYYDLFGKENVIMFDKKKKSQEFDTCDIENRDRKAIVYARNVCFDIAKDLGLTYFLELDDDYIEFRYRYEKNGVLSSMLVMDMNRIIDETIQFLENSGALTIAFAQAGDFIGGLDCSMYKNRLARKCMNSFFCKVDRKFDFIGRINEDVNTYVWRGTRGELLLTIADIVLNQGDTQQNKGGMSDIYVDIGTYVKSFYSVMTNPSCVKISTMGVNHHRIHHSIDWEHCLPKIINEKWRKE